MSINTLMDMDHSESYTMSSGGKMNVPQVVKDLFPDAYGWSNPRFAMIEQGVVFYQTIAHSNAGGHTHTVSFRVNISGRNLSNEEKWETLVDDVAQAVKAGAFRRRGYSLVDH